MTSFEHDDTIDERAISKNCWGPWRNIKSTLVLIISLLLNINTFKCHLLRNLCVNKNWWIELSMNEDWKQHLTILGYSKFGGSVKSNSNSSKKQSFWPQNPDDPLCCFFEVKPWIERNGMEWNGVVGATQSLSTQLKFVHLCGLLRSRSS